MRLQDRITGQNLNLLPAVIHSGRYFLNQAATLNRHTSLEAGALICSDGTDRCQLGTTQLPFLAPTPALIAREELFRDAISTIAGLMDGGVERPSPLLPGAMVNEQSQETSLERMLENVLRTGHLHSISIRPRIDLKYEDLVTDVSRARRLSNASYTHLASHSECWQRQTLSGVQPRRVLARFSEDEYSTYENRVYARLLDGLDIYLTTRLHRLEALRDDLEQALRITESKDLHFRLSNEICALWGQTYDAEQKKHQIDLTQNILEKIGFQLKGVRGLKQAGLYLMVPRSLRVGAALHRTNILTHDQHYRHLALLWDELQKARQLSDRTPAAVFAANQQLELSYSRYVGLVLRHALSRYGLNSSDSAHWAGHKIQIQQSGLEWHLIIDGASVLELIPWACLDSLPDDVQKLARHRIVCWPGLAQNDPFVSVFTGSALCVSPMDLYAVERVGAVIDQELCRFLLRHFGKPIQPLPSAVAAETRQLKGIKVEGVGLQVLSPLDSEALRLARALFDKHARSAMSQAFTDRVEEVKALNICPVCEAPAELNLQQDGGFSSDCTSCSCKRYWRKGEEGRWDYQQLLGEVSDFRVAGRRGMAFSLYR